MRVLLALSLSVVCVACGAPGESDDAGSVTGGGGGSTMTGGGGGGGTTDDAGAPDAGPPDAGMSSDDAGTPDAGNPFENLDPLADAGPAQRLDGGFQFLEGPQWMPSLNALLFSDIPANRIFQFTPPGTITTFRTPSGNSNGLALAPNGDLIICQHQGQVQRLRPDGGTTTVASTFDGGTLNSPNDAVVRSDGTIYFTDPTYGGTGTVGFRGVYRVDPSGVLSLVHTTTTGQPNGVALSPDERTLYVSDSQLSEVRRFDVAPDGTTSNGARFTLTSAGGPGGVGGDGITTDVNGNLYVSTSVGVKVYRPDAGYLGRVTLAEEPANCAFGDADGRTLYITARTGLYRVRLNVPGPR